MIWSKMIFSFVLFSYCLIRQGFLKNPSVILKQLSTCFVWKQYMHCSGSLHCELQFEHSAFIIWAMQLHISLKWHYFCSLALWLDLCFMFLFSSKINFSWIFTYADKIAGGRTLCLSYKFETHLLKEYSIIQSWLESSSPGNGRFRFSFFLCP